MLLTILPLAVFISQVAGNPGGIEIRIESIKPLDNESTMVKLVLHYSLDVPLDRVRVLIGDKSIVFDNIVKGVAVREVALTYDDLRGGVKEVELVIAGLFKMSLRY